MAEEKPYQLFSHRQMLNYLYLLSDGFVPGPSFHITTYDKIHMEERFDG